jgi:hypothetical protein
VVVLAALVVAAVLHTFVREDYLTQGCVVHGQPILLLCLRQRRPEWVDPLALVLISVAVVLSAFIVMRKGRFANPFANPS